MKTIGCLALTAVLVALAGCSTAPGADCGCLQANCCSWDFYRPCDLIEGRQAACDVDLCRPGTVVNRCYAVPVEAPPAVVAPAPVEDDTAEFGLPPAGR